MFLNAVWLLRLFMFMQHQAGLDNSLIANEPRYSVFSAIENAFHHIVSQPALDLCQWIGVCESAQIPLIAAPQHEELDFSVLGCDQNVNCSDHVTVVEVPLYSVAEQVFYHDQSIAVQDTITTVYTSVVGNVSQVEASPVSPYPPYAEEFPVVRSPIHCSKSPSIRSPTVYSNFVAPTATALSTSPAHIPLIQTKPADQTSGWNLWGFVGAIWWLENNKGPSLFPTLFLCWIVFCIAAGACHRWLSLRWASRRSAVLASLRWVLRYFQPRPTIIPSSDAEALINSLILDKSALEASSRSQQEQLRTSGVVSRLWQILARRWKRLHDECKAELRQLRQDAQKSNAVASWWRAVYLSVKVLCDDLQAQLADRDGKLVSLVKRHIREAKETSSALKRAQQAEQRNQTLEHQLEELKIKLSSAETSLDSTEAELLDNQQNFESSRSKLSELEADLEATRSSNKALSRKNEYLEKQLKDHQSCRSDAEFQKAHRNCVPGAEVADLQAKLQEKTEQCARKEKRILDEKAAHKEAIAQLVAERTELTMKEAATESRVAILENAHGGRIDVLTSQKNRFESENAELQNQFKFAEQCHAQHDKSQQQKYDDLLNANTDLWTNEIVEAEAKARGAARKLASKDEQLSQLRTKFQGLIQTLITRVEKRYTCPTEAAELNSRELGPADALEQPEAQVQGAQIDEQPQADEDVKSITSEATDQSEATGQGAASSSASTTDSAATSVSAPPSDAPAGPSLVKKPSRRAGVKLTDKRHQAKMAQGLPHNPLRVRISAFSSTSTLPLPVQTPRTPVSASTVARTPSFVTTAAARPRFAPSTTVPTLSAAAAAFSPTTAALTTQRAALTTPPSPTTPSRLPRAATATTTGPRPALPAAPPVSPSRLPRPSSTNGGLQASKWA